MEHRNKLIREALETAEWTNPTVYTKHGVAHGRSTARIEGSHRQALYDALGVDPPYHNIWWAKIDPGGFVIPHIDAGPPFYDRWHYPVEPAGFFWQEGMLTEPTNPFQVKHWRPHAVGNPTDRPRIHLMVERNVVVFADPTSLQKTEMIPEIQELIDRLENE